MISVAQRRGFWQFPVGLQSPSPGGHRPSNLPPPKQRVQSLPETTSQLTEGMWGAECYPAA